MMCTSTTFESGHSSIVNSPLNDPPGLIEYVGIVSSIIQSEFLTTLTSPGKVCVFPLLIRVNGILTLSPITGAATTPSEDTTNSRLGEIKLVLISISSSAIHDIGRARKISESAVGLPKSRFSCRRPGSIVI